MNLNLIGRMGAECTNKDPTTKTATVKVDIAPLLVTCPECNNELSIQRFTTTECPHCGYILIFEVDTSCPSTSIQ